LAHEIQRTIPSKTDNITHEYIHPSVLEQSVTIPKVSQNIKANPTLLCELQELEDLVKKEWPWVPGDHSTSGKDGEQDVASQKSMLHSLQRMTSEAEKTEVMVDEGGKPRYEESWLGSIIHELKSWTG